MNMLAALLDRFQVAELLGICVRHVDELRSRGALPCIKIGKSVRFRPEAVAALITAGELSARANPHPGRPGPRGRQSATSAAERASAAVEPSTSEGGGLRLPGAAEPAGEVPRTPDICHEQQPGNHGG